MTGIPATVITPLLHGSRAVSLANGMFRKRVLPVGSVEYKGRQLKFSRDYLAGLVDAFRDRAYDFCPVQVADASNQHTNSPEATRGRITDMELADDGLWITAELGADGERMLSQYPEMGISARMVENYARSDGKFYPAALQHALITLDPRVPQLGAWQPVEMSNDGSEVLIDLSTSAWAGEPGPAFELAASAVGARINVPSRDINFPAGSHDDIDAASLPQQDYGTTGLAEFGQAFELANAAELIRLEQDAEPLAVRTEDRIARALERIGAGTFTPRGAAAYGLANEPDPMAATTGGVPCGFIDATGRCGERYHATSCNALADPFTAETLRPQMEQIAHRPHLDADGQVWLDREFGSQMSLLDHVEAMTGIRQGDVGLFETGRSRRELAQVQRPVVLGDPDDEDALSLDIPAGTARTAAALAAQAGISTAADHQAQAAAWKAQHARQAARLGSPRHADYAADLSNPAHQDTGLAEFGDPPLVGSLPVYAAGAR